MVLAAMWVVTAAMVGFSLGRFSMYGQVVYEEGPGGDEQGTVSDRSGQGKQTDYGNQAGQGKQTDYGNQAGQGKQTDYGNQAGQEKQTGHGNQTGQGKQAGRGNQTVRHERRTSWRRRGKKGEDDHVFWSVGSPVSGEVTAQRDGEQPTVTIRPDGDKLYAPAGGKITRVFPMGNAFLFSTEFGAELYIQAGETDDELMVCHYRPRIMQNEVVGKGKLLLEFDKAGLEAEGISTEVSVSVESSVYGGDIRMQVGERVKTGEEILQVRGA